MGKKDSLPLSKQILKWQLKSKNLRTLITMKFQL
jgi:hypothetical protein